MKNKFLKTILVLALCVGSVLLIRTFKPNPEEILKKRIAERSMGDPKAKVWITEYFDYQCPPCAAAHKILRDWMAAHPGKIYLQVRYYPLPVHKYTMKAAVYAECASRQRGKFLKFHDALFDHQLEWLADAYPELKFLKYAQDAGLELNRWDACTKDPEVEKFVTEEKSKADKLGVKITPSFFVNGKLVVGTKVLAEELDAVASQK